MIEEVVIRDLGVIGEARLEFGAGFTALTGETGAGKTMVLTALGLLLGARADSAAVRKGAAQTEVHGRWALDPANPVAASVTERLTEAEVSIIDGELIVSRSVSAEGKSRAAISARPIPISLLDEIGNNLVVVHGQADQLKFRSAAVQREALDNFGGVELADALARYSAAFQTWREAVRTLEEMKNLDASRERELEDLKVLIESVDAVNPLPGEDVELAALAQRLTNTQDIRSSLAAAHEALSSEEVGGANDALGLLAVARKALEHGATYDERLSDAADQLRELGFAVRDVAGQVASALAEIEGESELSLDEVQERRAQISSLLRKYGPQLDDVLAAREVAGARQQILDSTDEQIAELESKLLHIQDDLKVKAEELHVIRVRYGAQLASEVTAELQALAMPGAELVVQVTTSDYATHGADDVGILLRSYAGAEPRPIGKGASGGELSRIMLAIEVVLSKGKSNPTFIFDEVDAGVGGAAAIEIGKRLARLAKQAQVIVVTHLAQVAAFADTHLRVMKNHDGEYTRSDVVSLTEVARVEELARMLSGMTDSELARAHAAELWQSAKLQRA